MRTSLRRSGFSSLALAVCGVFGESELCAQRAGENAITSAEDAFGTTVGRESLGLYSQSNVRGFSPASAGNFRIEGIYFDRQADLTGRLQTGSTIHVGPSAQGYAFPAPTGIVDIGLRPSGDKLLVSTLADYGPFGSHGAEVDAQIPLNGHGLSTAIGGAAYYNGFSDAGHAKTLAFGVVPRWHVTPELEIIGFWGIRRNTDETAQAVYIVDGPELPGRISRGHYPGPGWTRTASDYENGGVIGKGIFGPWTVRAGLFRSVYSDKGAFANLYLIDASGGIDRDVVAYPASRNASTSGELRVSRSFEEGPRLHLITATARGRQVRIRYGGANEADLGPAPLNGRIDPPKPAFQFSERSLDRVKQATGGLSYSLRWRHLGEVTLSVQRTHYRQLVTDPQAPRAGRTSDTWLPSVTAAAPVIDGVSVYGSFIRGLENGPVAPAYAINGYEVLPAVRTRQFDLGLRWQFAKGSSLILGYFDISKPNYDLDRTNLYRSLGRETHRGLEASLTATPLKGLDLVAGAVLAKPRVSSSSSSSEVIGRRPVGQPDVTLQFNANYVLPFATNYSVDATVNHQSSEAASVDNSATIAPITTLDLGARRAFEVGKSSFVVRLVVLNVTNAYSYYSLGSNVYAPLDHRTVSIYVAADF